MAELNVGKLTQIVSAVIDIKFPEGKLPEINEAINVPLKDGGKLVVEVAQHLGDDTVRVLPWDQPTVWFAVWKHMQRAHRFLYR